MIQLPGPLFIKKYLYEVKLCCNFLMLVPTWRLSQKSIHPSKFLTSVKLIYSYWRKYLLFTRKDIRHSYHSLKTGKTLNLFMILYSFGCRDFKNLVSFFSKFWIFALFLEKIKTLTFSKTYFSIQISQNLSASSHYESIQLWNTIFAINVSGNSAKNF